MADEKVESNEETVEIPAKFKTVVEHIDKLTVLELSELVKVLEKHYGVSAAAPMAMAAAPAAGDDAGAAEEKSAFTVMLTSELKPAILLKFTEDSSSFYELNSLPRRNSKRL